MVRSRGLRSLAAITALTLVAAACGDDDDSGDSSDDTTAEEAAEDTEAPADTEGEEATEETEAPADTEATEDTEAPADTEGEEAAAGGGGTVSYGIVEPAAIDSYNTQDSEGFEVARLLFDGLTDYGDDLNAVPAVAESWEPNEDNTVWTFTLRDDVTFHDGTPVTAQSFVDGWNYVANPDNLSDVSYQGSYIANIQGWSEVEAGEADSISGVVAVDDTTLEVTLNEPYSVLPKVMAHPVFSPRAEASTDPDAPIGNGPYMMDGSWDHDVQITLVRYDDYYGEAGLPAEIQFKILDSIETMYLEVQAGGLDIGDVPPEQIESAEAEFGDNYIFEEIGSYTYLGFPTDTAPYDNPDIRKAVSIAIDRQPIMDSIFAGTRVPATGFAPSLAPGATECEYTTYDPEAAVELFEAAGGIDGPVQLWFNSGGGHEDWTQAVANQWQQVLGIESVEFTAQEFAPYLDTLQADGAPGPFRLGWLWDAPTAENFLSPLFLSSSTDNYTRYVNPDFDAAIVEFKAAPTEEEGFPALADAQAVLCEDMPVAPIMFSATQKVHTDNVSDVNVTVFGFTELENVVVE